MLALGSGAQRIRGMQSIALGVTTARRGWAEPRHLLNTRPLPRGSAISERKRTGKGSQGRGMTASAYTRYFWAKSDCDNPQLSV